MHTASLSSTRREWLTQALGLLSVAAAPSLAFAQNKAHIVIVGGGVGGATAAKYLKLFNPALQVTLVERNPVYIRPYGSSEVLNGHTTMAALDTRYDTLASRWGVDVRVAETVAGALAAAQHDRPDVLVADYHLHDELDGLEALASLREVCGAGTPAVLVTADGSDAVKRGARELGIPVLTKPVKPASLRAFLGAQRRSGG